MEEFPEYEALFKVCRSRRSSRAFADRPVPAGILDKIRTAALTSPYASGKKNWGITVVTDRDLRVRMGQEVERRAGEILALIRPDLREYFAAYARNFTFFAAAPALLVLTFRAAPSLSLMLARPSPELVQWERDNSVKSIACVAMLALLAAESLGLGACFVTGALIAERELAGLIPVPPGREIGALIPVGYKDGGGEK